jgi:hypothetical protein
MFISFFFKRYVKQTLPSEPVLRVLFTCATSGRGNNSELDHNNKENHGV